MTKRTCLIDECSKPHLARGWCAMHYRRWSKYGDPSITLNTPTSSPEESFALRTEWKNGCLVWTGSLNYDGYGQIWTGEKLMASHRWQWERKNGTIPSDMHLDHICHNPACCNTAHLRLSTREQNQAHRSGASALNAKSKVRNVVWDKSKWKVQMQKEGKYYYFGMYDTIEEAAEVARQARAEMFGDFAGRG